MGNIAENRDKIAISKFCSTNTGIYAAVGMAGTMSCTEKYIFRSTGPTK